MLVIASLSVAALSAQTFQTASVRRSSQAEGAGVPGPQQDPARIDYQGVTLQAVLAQAYGVTPDHVVGPKWLGEERFDIAATLPAGATTAQIPAMLQHLLAERFGMTVHEESKTTKFFALVPAGGGVKMKAVEKPEISATLDLMSDSIQLTDYTMPQFAQFLSKSMGRSVVDETGLTDAYNITLYLSMSDIKTARIRLAIRQLGLQFEERTAAMQSLIVDRANQLPKAD
jgi:uncharacterized protein (TIGR03435 family)